MLLSRSKRAPAIAVSSSEGFCLDGELRAILLIAAIFAVVGRGRDGEDGLLLPLFCGRSGEGLSSNKTACPNLRWFARVGSELRRSRLASVALGHIGLA